MDIQYPIEIHFETLSLHTNCSYTLIVLYSPSNHVLQRQTLPIQPNTANIDLSHLKPFTFATRQISPNDKYILKVELQGEKNTVFTVAVKVNQTISKLKDSGQFLHSESCNMSNNMMGLKYRVEVQQPELPSPCKRMKTKLCSMKEVESIQVPLRNTIGGIDLQPIEAVTPTIRSARSTSQYSVPLIKVNRQDQPEEKQQEHNENKESVLFGGHKDNLKMKVLILLACLGLVFVFFDVFSAQEDLHKSASIYKRGRRTKNKKRPK